ncbi:hypothetical protein HCBG_05596 [Histoplasma capsulatum G186AR]|uniref:Uncharacterized protein n=1 Tax=Ajellomyces capsulatus (strain G186AR / H82 / ATCC MYA-2454 / RMSCC 2432) TaxID=447093 RepID=C0NRG6_AJECG|nr:uncharacterized protein HCBG_05596 [Histoplasma capsulatum G186AR]EEH06280.1 hypothetical protein HCBG_05596 [Histoplasma capsulatum G186AR]
MGAALETSKRAYERFRSICRSAKSRITRPGDTKPVPPGDSSEPATVADNVSSRYRPTQRRISPSVGGAPGPSPPPSTPTSCLPQGPMTSGVGGTLSPSAPRSTSTSSLDESPLDKNDVLREAPIAGFRLPSRKAQLIMQAYRLGHDNGCTTNDLSFHGWFACVKLNTAIYFRSNAKIVDGQLILKLDVSKRAINPSFKAHLQIGVLDNMIPEMYLKFSKFSFNQRSADSTVFIHYPNSDAEVRATMTTNPQTKVRDMRVTLWCNLGGCESPFDSRRDNNAGSYHDPTLLGDCRTISPEESLYMKHFNDTSPSKFGDYLSSGRMLTGFFGQ